MGPILYFDGANARARAVLLVAKAAGVSLDLVEVDSFSKESDASERAVPTLQDGECQLSETAAICQYLAGSSQLMPQDDTSKEEILTLMNYDAQVLVPAISDILCPILQEKECEIPASRLRTIHEIYSFLNEKLKEKEYLTESLSVADLVIVASVSTFTTILPISSESYQNLFQWYSRLKALPYYKDSNEKGLNKLDALLESKLRRI